MSVKITCDNCNVDLSTTGNSVDYRIKLQDEYIPSAGGIVTDMMKYPALGGGVKHFCRASCLSKWVSDFMDNGRDDQ